MNLYSLIHHSFITQTPVAQYSSSEIRPITVKLSDIYEEV